MEYPAFTVNFPVILVTVMVTIVVGVIALVLNSLKKRRIALILSSATVLLITAFVIASGFLEAARTSEMLRAADDLAVPEGFKIGSVEGRTSERIVQATGNIPSLPGRDCALPVPAPAVVGSRRSGYDAGRPGTDHPQQRVAGKAGHQRGKLRAPVHEQQ